MEDAEIDFAHLNLYVDGSADLTSEIFNLFKNQVDMWSKQLIVDLPDDVWAAMTHSLKGTARAVGAMRLAEYCEKAEDLIGGNNRSGAREVAIFNIENRIQQALTDIQRWEYRQTILQLKSE